MIDIKRDWYLIDAKEEVLGRMSTRAATLLMGKTKTSFVPYQDMGDHVVVINSQKVRLTGKKETDKVYTRYSGYPGGLRTETAGELRQRRPEQMVRLAVSRMLPKNKLQAKRLNRLHIYAGAEHPYAEKFGGK